MKVVLFAGGFGVRMGEETQRIPKPMIPIGSRPILWHIMQYFAAWGHRDFVVCLGYKGDVIKDYFLDHGGALFRDVTIFGSNGSSQVEVHSDSSAEWSMTFVDTGLDATIGERLKAIESHLGDDDEFLATYGDGLVDADLDEVIAAFRASRRLVQFLSVRPVFNAHLVETDPSGAVVRVEDLSTSEVRINGGYFVCRRELLDWIEPGDELVEETFARLIPRGDVGAYTHDGFFGPMDTIKDRQRLEALLAGGHAPWQVAEEPAERV